MSFFFSRPKVQKGNQVRIEFIVFESGFFELHNWYVGNRKFLRKLHLVCEKKSLNFIIKKIGILVLTSIYILLGNLKYILPSSSQTHRCILGLSKSGWAEIYLYCPEYWTTSFCGRIIKILFFLSILSKVSERHQHSPKKIWTLNSFFHFIFMHEFL